MLSHTGIRPVIYASLGAVGVQIPLFGLLDAYPLIFHFDHTNLRKLFTLESYLIFSLIELLCGTGALLIGIGLPLFAVTRAFRFEGGVRNWSSGLIGFVVAAAPQAITFWPWRNPYLAMGDTEYRFWIGKEIPLALDGAPTAYAWIDCFIELTRMGLHGLVASLVFYSVWRAASARLIVQANLTTVQ